MSDPTSLRSSKMASSRAVISLAILVAILGVGLIFQQVTIRAQTKKLNTTLATLQTVSSELAAAREVTRENDAKILFLEEQIATALQQLRDAGLVPAPILTAPAPTISFPPAASPSTPQTRSSSPTTTVPRRQPSPTTTTTRPPHPTTTTQPCVARAGPVCVTAPN